MEQHRVTQNKASFKPFKDATYICAQREKEYLYRIWTKNAQISLPIYTVRIAYCFFIIR